MPDPGEQLRHAVAVDEARYFAVGKGDALIQGEVVCYGDEPDYELVCFGTDDYRLYGPWSDAQCAEHSVASGTVSMLEAWRGHDALPEAWQARVDNFRRRRFIERIEPELQHLIGLSVPEIEQALRTALIHGWDTVEGVTADLTDDARKKLRVLADLFVVSR